MRGWISATITLTLALAAAGQSLVAAAPSTASPPAAAAPCAPLRITGTAKRSGDHHVLGRFGVAVFIHQGTSPLAKSRAGANGGYVLTLCKSAGFRRYADRHHGMVNLDVVAHAWRSDGAGDFYVRTLQAPVSASSVRVPASLVRAYTRTKTNGRMAASAQPAPALGSSIVHPGVMRIEAIRHMQVDYNVSHNSVAEVEVHVGARSGAFTASGDMSVSRSSGFSRTGRLRLGSKEYAKAQVVEPLLEVSARYTCYAMGSWGAHPTPVKCLVESSGAWDGRIHLEDDQHRGCWWSGNRRIFPWSGTTPSVHSARGATFTATAKVGLLDSNLSISTKYDAATHYSYAFDQDKPRHFCVSGDERIVATSAKLYVSQLKPKSKPGGCPARHRPSSGVLGCV